MSDESTSQPDPRAVAWVKLWHPKGCDVRLPIQIDDPPQQGDWQRVLQSVSDAIEAGWLTTAPGLEEGENRDLCGAVVRSQKDGHSGTSEVVDLYLPDDKFAKIRVYLNKPEDVAAFEFASKMRIDKLPLYIGSNKIEIGKSRQTDSMVAHPPKAFGFVWKNNPKWNEQDKVAAVAKGEVYSVPRRVFVRWADQKPAEPTVTEEAPDAKVVGEWMTWLNKDPTIMAVNTKLKDIKKIDHKPTRMAVWQLVKQRMEGAGYVYSEQVQGFVEPAKTEEFSEFV